MPIEKTNAPIANANTPDVREPSTDGLKGQKRGYPVADDSDSAPTAPKTGGASSRADEPLKNPLADRNSEGPRQAGKTPRPTEKPGD